MSEFAYGGINRSTIYGTLYRAKITDELNLKTDLDADSIDFVEFVLELEDTFGEEIDDEDAEKLSTIGEVVDYIAEHTAD